MPNLFKSLFYLHNLKIKIVFSSFYVDPVGFEPIARDGRRHSAGHGSSRTAGLCSGLWRVSSVGKSTSSSPFTTQREAVRRGLVNGAMKFPTLSSAPILSEEFDWRKRTNEAASPRASF